MFPDSRWTVHARQQRTLQNTLHAIIVPAEKSFIFVSFQGKMFFSCVTNSMFVTLRPTPYCLAQSVHQNPATYCLHELHQDIPF